jgi:penicillin amidase
MSPRIVKPLRTIVLSVLILVVALGLLGLYTVRRSFPQTRGTITLNGLDGPVDVVRDSMGVPHIYASSEHDLFMAQGFVHAQDRFWQMDFWRHIGSGRLSEMFGEDQLETDQFLRTLGWARVVQQELNLLDPATIAALQAYADGVNAYLATHRGSALSLEYAFLGLLHPDYSPGPWEPLHSLTWAKAMAWDLGGNMDMEIQRAVLSRKLTPEMLEQLFPPYPSANPVIVTGEPSASLPSTSASQTALTQASALLEEISARADNVDRLLGGGFPGVGSNNWVVGGTRTTTGMPLLANDTHLGIRMPSIWYENSLHCRTITADCRLDVAGFSFAGLPGVVIGHNANIAWGVTNGNPDVQDLYLEKINPENPDQYEVNGHWVDMQTVDEVIQVAGGEPVQMTIRYTRHGPVLSDVSDSQAAMASAEAGQTGDILAVSLRWTALDPCTIIEAALMIDHASNWDEFRQALEKWDVPSQNFVYADVQGNIGYQFPGRIPIRADGDGRAPVPGWTDRFEWTGYVAFDELPHLFNPPQGFIVTANNAVIPDAAPIFLSSDWDYGYRAARITAMIEATPTVGIADFQRMEGDDDNPAAPVLLPLLEQLDFQDTNVAQAAVILQAWDRQNTMDSSPAALFNAFWRHLLLRTFGDDLPAGWLPDGSAAVAVVNELVGQPDNPWWDDLRTPILEMRDDILRSAMADAVAELQAGFGEDPANWSWGEMHTATFQNETLGASGIGPIEAIFNRGPYPTAGGDSIVNATGWDAEQGYAVDWIPSERMIVDLSDMTNSLSTHSTGQSGHAYHPHYVDMADMWRLIQYHPMLWTQAQVESAAEGTMTLTPGGE